MEHDAETSRNEIRTQPRKGLEEAELITCNIDEVEMRMFFPIAVEAGSESKTFGVVVPDIPGCFSAGDTLDEALRNAKEAIDFHLEGLVEDGADIPVASSVQTHAPNPEYQGFIWAVVDIDIAQYLGKAEKINVTLPASLITRIDRFVSTHPEYKTRSGFLATAALATLAHN